MLEGSHVDPVTAPYAALILRLCLGVMFIAHATLKWRVFTIPGTIAFFKSLGLPGLRRVCKPPAGLPASLQ